MAPGGCHATSDGDLYCFQQWGYRESCKEGLMDLEVYSRRWGHNDTYRVDITDAGWYISHFTIGGECDPGGKPYLFENFEQDVINYPADIGNYLAFLWERAKKDDLSDDEVQRHLNALGQWIQTTERSTPGGFFADYR